MFKKGILLSLLALVFLQACDNDVKINADYKKITYVFGLLDQTEPIHYIKINKAYLGEGNALVFAQIFDSLYYKDSEIDVRIEEIKNGNLTRQFVLNDTMLPKNPGIFHSPDQQIWHFKATLDPLATYRLTIKNNQTNELTIGQTNLVNGINLASPNTISTSISYLPSTQQYIYRWTTGPNGKLYEILAKFPVGEKNLVNGDSTTNNLTWNLGRVRSNTSTGGSELTIRVPNRDFFQFMKANLNPVNENDPNQNLKRYLKKVTIILSVASEDFTTYLDVSQPSNTVAQERPTFNNITNGYGLFSARTSINRQLNVANQLVDSLKVNPLTENLGFQ